MKKKVIIGGALVILIIAIIAVNVLKSGSSVSTFAAGPAFNVKTQKVEKGNITSTISASGIIEEIEKSEVYIDTPLKIQKINVEKNQKVTKGQKLIELDMDSLNSELEQLKISKTVQQLSKKSVVTQSDTVRALNAVKSAQRAFDDGKKNYENSKSLFSANAISKNELDAAEKAMTEAGIALENAKVAYESSVTGKSVSVETQDQNLKATDLKIADLEKKIKKLNDSMFSPIDGVITEVNVTEGGFTTNVQPAFKLVNPDKLQVKADVKEFDIKSVKAGQNVKITGDAIAREDDVTGKVQSVSSVAKKNRTTSGEETLIEVIVAVEKSNPVLKPGLSVTCDITTNEKNDVLLVPFQMLKEDKDGNKIVYVVDKKDNVMFMHERKIKLGVSSELNAEVLEGLKEGDTVVLDPQPTYKDGSRVKVSNKDEKKK